MAELRRRENSIKSAGLFADKMVLKGVTLVSALGRNDLRKIHNWMRRQGSSAANYSELHGRSVNSTDLINGGSNNLGYISFGTPNFLSVGTIALVATLPKTCYITTLRLPKGVTYLSLYVALDQSASEKLFDVDVQSVQSYKCFGSLNPFSQRFKVIEHHDRYNAIDEVIFRNARDVVDEVNQAVLALLQVWGVKKDISEFSTVADFCRDSSEPYFTDHYVADDDTVANERHAAFESWRGRGFCTNITDDKLEEFLEGYVAEKVGVDGVFIKSEVFSATDKDDLYLYNMHSATEFYTYLMYVDEANKQFKRCMNIVSPIFLNFTRNTRRNLRILIEASLALNLVQERVEALKDGIHLSDPKYQRFIQGRLSWLKNKVDGLGADIEKRKDLNNSQLQLSNLLWTKRYSILVGFLVIVQIALSLVVLDWTEAGKDKNPIYLNFFKDTAK